MTRGTTLRGLARRVRDGLAGDRLEDGVRWSILADQRRALARRRAFGPADFEQLDSILCQAEAVVSVRTVLELPAGQRSPRQVVLRHDTDGDIDNAVRFAEWEAARGYRASYYVLHTDWYYRDGFAGPPSRYVLRALERIQHLGHEIGLHNNAITVALRTGRDPVEVLSTELDHLRRAGFDVTGTAAPWRRAVPDLRLQQRRGIRRGAPTEARPAGPPDLGRGPRLGPRSGLRPAPGTHALIGSHVRGELPRKPLLPHRFARPLEPAARHGGARVRAA